MTSRLLLLLVGLVVTGTAVFATRSTAASRDTNGHLALVVEGDARGLAVTFVAAKKDPYGRDLTKSEYQIVVRAANGAELGRFPLDLSAFDLDPRRVGKPARVEGDQLFATRVGALTNVPRFVDGASLEIRRGARVLGTLDAVTYARMLREADLR